MALTPRCPTCRVPVGWQDNPHRPFCSERCRLADLGSWVTERYRIPGAPVDPEASDEVDLDDEDPS
jgi:endogenous inhibitor of DNA gyrase (YacG/DUF329 family)